MPEQKCETCGKSDDQESILVCDSCELGYHTACLDPSTTTLSEHDWHCPKCLVGTGEFGFEDGGVYSLKQFQEKANEFKKKYFASKMPFDPVLNTHRRETEDDVEAEFWKLVVDLHETVEVEYGADIHSTTHGSGFPTIERNPLDQFSSDPWNLNVLPFYGDSLFRYIKSDISGMTVPWVYVGMCFSTFCWHNEDHYAYSANYQHFGATKTWYGIPGADAEAFEAAMRDAVPELFEGQPDLLFQLVTLMPPDKLRKAGVNVYAVDQRAGQFVLTFPQAYHAGFNHGFNFNEAVNFAPADWEPYGAAGVERLQSFRRHPCFSHDELLLTAAARDTSIATAKWLAPALQRTCVRELGERAAFLYTQKEVSARTSGSGIESMSDTFKPKFVVEDEDLPEDDYQCQHCKAFAYLTQFRCHKSGKTVCLSHVETYDCCDQTFSQKLCGPDHTLRYRMSDDALQALVQKVQERARIPEAWSEKLDKTLEDEPKPQLKALHNLLNEGEKIPYHLPGLQDLAAFVQRCDKWVDEANNYITRKQQNRRKNEKAWRRASTKAAQLDDRDREVRRVEHIYALLAEADKLSFDCPQMAALEEKTREIEKFRQDINGALMNPHTRPIQDVEELIEAGKNFNVEIPELERLEQVSRQIKWIDEAARRRDKYMSLKDCHELVAGAEQLGLSETNEHLVHFKELARHGDAWELKARELMSVEAVHYQQLEALSAQTARFPVSPETLAAVEAILTKQREAQKRIQTLYEKSKDPEMKNRPKYKDIRDLMESLEHLTSRPIGAIDLEREQKRHEDWMRKGKKLFGKANAPLHILRSHMEYVEKRNSYCFDLEDSYRPPVEPSSRDNSPEGLLENNSNPNPWGPKSRKRDVFCICRHSEAGMMIECEVCHEW
jgi:histone demethylase JARID1